MPIAIDQEIRPGPRLRIYSDDDMVDSIFGGTHPNFIAVGLRRLSRQEDWTVKGEDPSSVLANLLVSSGRIVDTGFWFRKPKIPDDPRVVMSLGEPLAQALKSERGMQALEDVLSRNIRVGIIISEENPFINSAVFTTARERYDKQLTVKAVSGGIRLQLVAVDGRHILLGTPDCNDLVNFDVIARWNEPKLAQEIDSTLVRLLLPNK